MGKARRTVSTRYAIAALLAVYGLALPSLASARDLHGRLGLGYNAEFSNFDQTGGVPAVSIKYALTRDIAVEAIAGVSTSSPTNSVTAVKFFKNVFLETNLNFYGMFGGGLLSASGRSGAEFIGGFGAEAFIPGLESLGFSMETGGGFDNVRSGSYGFRTLGVSFLNAGMHFYF